MNTFKLTIFFLIAVMAGCASVPANIYYDYEVTTPASPLLRVKPGYPPSAARKGISGFIVADLVIGDDGQVEEINIVESVPSGIFDKKGEIAIEKWQYKPAQLNAMPVKQYVKVRLDWKI
jgi:periplasmic protein TonB